MAKIPLKERYGVIFIPSGGPTSKYECQKTGCEQQAYGISQTQLIVCAQHFPSDPQLCWVCHDVTEFQEHSLWICNLCYVRWEGAYGSP